VDPAGNIYIGDTINHRIRKVTTVANASHLTSEDISFNTDPNGLGYIMSPTGQHKTTIDLETGVTLRQFEYDANNNLVSVTDQFGNQVVIERDANGIPTSIVSPDGVTTSLAIDGNNHLTGITYPGGSGYSFEYATDGLMTAITEPEGIRFDYAYGSFGRVTNASNEEGGNSQYSITLNNIDGTLAHATSTEGNLTSYLDFTDSSGATTSTVTTPDSEQTVFSSSADGLTLNGTVPCDIDMELKYDLDSEYLTFRIR